MSLRRSISHNNQVSNFLDKCPQIAFLAYTIFSLPTERDTADERVIQGIRYRTHRRSGKAIISGEAYILEDGPSPTKSSSEAMEISSETAATMISFGPAN